METISYLVETVSKRKAIENKMEYFWRSTELTLIVCAVPSNNPDKYLGCMNKLKKKGNRKKSCIYWEKKEENNFLTLR